MIGGFFKATTVAISYYNAPTSISSILLLLIILINYLGLTFTYSLEDDNSIL